MSDEVPVEAPGRAPWRVVCGQVGWGVFALSILLSFNVVLAVFKGAVGLALHVGASGEVAAAVAWLWGVVTAAVSATVLAVLGRRWILFALAGELSLFSLVLATQSRFAGS